MKPDEIENGGVYIGHDGARRFVDQIDVPTNAADRIAITYMAEVESGPILETSLEAFAAWAKSPAALTHCNLGRAA